MSVIAELPRAEGVLAKPHKLRNLVTHRSQKVDGRPGTGFPLDRR